MTKSYAITVSGKVQGVFFRKFTKEKAVESGLNGFVRNQNDGSVYIEVTGEETVLEDFIQWCHTDRLSQLLRKLIKKFHYAPTILSHTILLKH
ncbi:MAG: acylphosphatase [Bacteroidia bacterium]